MAKAKVVVKKKVSRKDGRHQNEGRPLMFTERQQKAIARLSKEHGAAHAHRILTARKGKLAALRPSVFESALQISYITVVNYCKRVGLALPIGRRTVA